MLLGGVDRLRRGLDAAFAVAAAFAATVAAAVAVVVAAAAATFASAAVRSSSIACWYTCAATEESCVAVLSPWSVPPEMRLFSTREIGRVPRSVRASCAASALARARDACAFAAAVTASGSAAAFAAIAASRAAFAVRYRSSATWEARPAASAWCCSAITCSPMLVTSAACAFSDRWAASSSSSVG